MCRCQSCNVFHRRREVVTLAGIDTTEGLLNTEHAYVFELVWTQVVSVLCVAYFLACSVTAPTACRTAEIRAGAVEGLSG